MLELNDKLEKQLLKQNKIQFSGQWYVGRPVMVMQNHPGLQLYNGDIGICLADLGNKQMGGLFSTCRWPCKKSAAQ